jgi:hypothetical protein
VDPDPNLPPPDDRVLQLDHLERGRGGYRGAADRLDQTVAAEGPDGPTIPGWSWDGLIEP